MIDFSQSVLLVEMMVFLEKLKVDMDKETDRGIRYAFNVACDSVEVLMSKLSERMKLNNDQGN